MLGMPATARIVEACSCLSDHNESKQGYSLPQQTYPMYTSGTYNKQNQRMMYQICFRLERKIWKHIQL